MTLQRKKIISSVLALATGFSLLAFPTPAKAEKIEPPSPLSISIVDGESQIYAQLKKTKKGSIIEITGKGKMSKNINDPSRRWFSSFEDSIREVHIKKGVNTIGEYAFGGDGSEGTELALPNLKTVTIPSSIVKIERGAFFGASSLTSIYIPGSVKELGGHAFNSAKNLKEITLDKGLEVIGSGAFVNCKSLKSITIPEGVTEIAGNTFDENLDYVILPKSLTKIRESAFRSKVNAAIYSDSVSIDKGAFLEGSVILCHPGSITEKTAHEHGGLKVKKLETNHVTSPARPLVKVSGKKLKINIAHVPNAKSYRIEYSKDKYLGSKVKKIKKRTATTKKLKKGTYYVYAVAVNGKNEAYSAYTKVKIK